MLALATEEDFESIRRRVVDRDGRIVRCGHDERRNAVREHDRRRNRTRPKLMQAVRDRAGLTGQEWVKWREVSGLKDQVRNEALNSSAVFFRHSGDDTTGIFAALKPQVR
jgi:hypothetical protein